MESKTKKGDKQQKKKKPLVYNHQSKTEHPPPPGYVPPSGTSDIVARLETLKGLLNKNLVTKEEYEKKRREILSQL